MSVKYWPQGGYKFEWTGWWTRVKWDSFYIKKQVAKEIGKIDANRVTLYDMETGKQVIGTWAAAGITADVSVKVIVVM